MGVHVCSLIANTEQEIPPNAYTLLHFPYVGESSDVWGMHDPAQPDGPTSVYPDGRSGLIWPAVSGWATLTLNVHWQSGNYTELRDRFVRDPLGLVGAPDSTATDHRVPSPGMQCFTKQHQIFVNPATPVGVMVWHNASVPRMVTHAQFKMEINPDVATP